MTQEAFSKAELEKLGYVLTMSTTMGAQKAAQLANDLEKDGYETRVFYAYPNPIWYIYAKKADG